MSVIVSRAIPQIDGFKPSHRKLLYTMYKMRLLKGNKTKSANVVGQTMKLNPHGDQAIYATLVRLTRGHDALLHPYIDSKGNFGKVTSRDMKFAASRYTEVKLAEICEEIFKDIDKGNVDMMDNYDGSMLEPELLPTTFPNVLVNANKGIAVGMASNICSFNLNEVCETTKALIENPEANILDTLKAPDFSSGGDLLYNEDEMKKIYNSGVGSFKIRAKYNYVKKENTLEITEIPYTTTVEQIIDKIVELVKSSKIKEISDIRDETDLKGLKIAIDLKRGTDVDKLMAKLYRFTTLEDSFSCNFNILVNGRPKVLGVRGIINAWLDFRISCIKRQLTYDIKALTDQLHLLYGLQKVLLDIDLAIKIIRETELDKLVIPNLMEAFSIDDIQANYVADIKLRNINKEYILKRTSEVSEMEKELTRLQNLLKSDTKIKKVIVKELDKVNKKYGRERRTTLIEKHKASVHNVEDQIEDYNLKVFFTDHNYLKKVTLVSLRSSGDHKLKDDDSIKQEIEGSNKDDILFFSNKQNVYKLKLYEIDDHKVSTLGVYLQNLLEMEEDESIEFVHVTRDYSGHMIFAYENGKVAKVPMKSYETKTNRKKLLKGYSDYSPLVSMHFISESVDLAAIRFSPSDEYRVVVFSSDLIPEKNTRNTRGIQVLRMKKNSTMINLKFKEQIVLENIDQYVVDGLPKSGQEISIMDRMNLDALVK